MKGSTGGTWARRELPELLQQEDWAWRVIGGQRNKQVGIASADEGGCIAAITVPDAVRVGVEVWEGVLHEGWS